MTTTALAEAAKDFKAELYAQQQKQLSALFNGDNERVLKFFSSCMYCFNAAPKLAECDRDSVIQAFMKIAEYDLHPSTVSGEAYVLPYGGKAQFQLGYKGIVKLLSRSGVVVANIEIIRENDQYDIQQGTSPCIKHSIPMTGDRGKALGVYVVVKHQGETSFKFMRADEVLAFQKFSQSLKTDKKYGKKDSPWHEENDPELWMWKKTCLKQLTKTLPLNDNLARAVEDDDVEGDIKEYQKQQLIEQGKKDDGFRINQLLEGKKETEDEKFDREFDEGLKESTDPITGEICTK